MANRREARRLGQSSALGMVLDHGCDAFNVILTAFSVCSVLQFGNSPKSLMILYTAMVPFFTGTWEEYYTGVLHLPVVNGPDEGVLIVSLSLILSGFMELIFGPGSYSRFWHTQVNIACISSNPLEYRDIISLVMLICACFTAGSNIFNVGKYFYKKELRLSQTCQNILDSLFLILPFGFVLSFPLLEWLPCSVKNQNDKSSSDFNSNLNLIRHSGFFVEFPRMTMWLIGLLFLKLVMHIQLAHVCDEKYFPWTKTVVFSLIFIISTPILRYCLHLQHHFINEFYHLCLCLIVSAVSWVHMVFCVGTEMSEILKTPVFFLAGVDEVKYKDK